MTINEAARKFEVSPGRIRVLATTGRIPGAEYKEYDSDGNKLPHAYWFIPDTLTALPTRAKAGRPPGKAKVQGAPPAPTQARRRNKH